MQRGVDAIDNSKLYRISKAHVQCTDYAVTVDVGKFRLAVAGQVGDLPPKRTMCEACELCAKLASITVVGISVK
jgi:hypothetical protein